MDPPAMCLRCEVVVATVSHSQSHSHSHSQSTSTKFHMAFVFIFANFFFSIFLFLSFFFWVMRCTCDAREEELHTTLFSVQSPTFLRLRKRHAHLVQPKNVCVRQIAVIVEKVFTYPILNFSFYFHILYSNVGVDVVLVVLVVVVGFVAVLLVAIVVVALYHSHLV